MEENKIEIVLEDKTLKGIAGYPYGEDIFNMQVKPKYKDKEGIKNIIIFPTTIEKVAISFVQGFMKELIKNKKKLDNLEIRGNEEFVKKFYQVM
jgi:hypothetical protein